MRASRLSLAPDAVSLKMPSTSKPPRSAKAVSSAIVREAVLEVTYTAHDMAAFARDMGYVDAAGEVLPPFHWDEDRRLQLRAKLDALYFHLYGVTDRDDIRYVYSTFPIVKQQQTQASGSYRSRELLPCVGQRAKGGKSGCGNHCVSRMG